MRPLTRRHRQVIALIAEGCTNDAIAVELGIGRGTVKKYVGQIFERLGANNRWHAVLVAVRAGEL